MPCGALATNSLLSEQFAGRNGHVIGAHQAFTDQEGANPRFGEALAIRMGRNPAFAD